MHAKALARTILGLGWRAKINDLCDTLNALLLRDLRCDADEPGQCIPLACPLARVDVLCIRGELDRQISRVHGPAIPLQPETVLLLSRTVFGQRIGPQIMPLFAELVAAPTHRSRLPPTERVSGRSSWGLG